MMIDLINYFFEANVILFAFFLAYLLIKSQPNFQFRRGFILAAIASSLLVPFVSIDINGGLLNSIARESTFNPLVLPELMVGGIIEEGSKASSGLTITKWIMGVYLVISLSFLIRFLYQLNAIRKIVTDPSNHKKFNGSYMIVESKNSCPTFSFLNYLIINRSVELTETEYEKIIAHEEVHIKEMHSIDIIILEFIRTIFWINPAVWALRRSQVENHEFIADKGVLRNFDIQEYQNLLVKMTIRQMSLVGNYFAKIQTLKRINMINEKRKQSNKWKLGIAASTAFAVITIMACSDDMLESAKSASVSLDMPESVAQVMTDLKQTNPGVNFVYAEIELPEVLELDNNDPKTEEKAIHSYIKKMTSNMDGIVEHVEVLKKDRKAGVILVPSEDFVKFAEYSKSEDGVYDLVEEIPMPNGGINEFYQFIAKSIKYPEEARKKGIQGKVFVSFVVDENGNLIDVETKEGIGYGCDEMAVSAIKKSDKWSPGKIKGKNVKTRMVLPITFMLEDGNSSDS